MTTQPSFTLLSTTICLSALSLAFACTDDGGENDTIFATADGQDTSTSSNEDDIGDTTTTDTTESTDTTTDSTDTETEGTGSTDETTDTGTTDTTDTTDGALFCTPGEVQCEGNAVITCTDDGSEFGAPVACEDNEGCLDGACVALCELEQLTPSSVGCSFFAQKMDNYDPDSPDSLVVGNVSETVQATVQLYRTPVDGEEQTVGNAVIIPPGGVQAFEMVGPEMDGISVKRTGGTYRVESDLPVIAYLHSPIESIYTNDASMLLPEYALRENHVVASYYPWLTNFYPSYFNVIATEDSTIVTWEPPVDTLSGVGVPAVNAGGQGQVVMNRGDSMQVTADNHVDVSGTFVSANKPIVLISGSEIVNVPAGTKYADHIEEQMLPLDYWGEEYVGPHAPTRGDEEFHWRLYGGEDDVVINVSPTQPGFPIILDRGEWYEFATDESVIFTSDGPFMPVQYLEGKSETGGAGTGDPSMYQMVPTEQFLDAYTFATGTGYTVTYVQVIRQQGGSAVSLDGQDVSGYYTVGNFEVADVEIEEGNHFINSDTPFGIIILGYTSATSYAFPGGMKLADINPQ
ncbi:IgGFc-binding protein [Pseudenhygromyxa sp. WMMC2535]|uniref:IgGFc-binding protein n=1 Tax=Pseudenhygromyxa sp. WMMC2535 TaxID=2712867 RepID=UPI001556C410|nr:IgGFc-binding protein [Pseudenhygromyxa sp. WMMC2535]NVB43146.1 IgGFc-binding protein [Pseudenhygromyxa sp. WMMC2535]